MEVKILANETGTVLEALKAYRQQLDTDISAVKHSQDTWAVDSLVSRIEQKKETLTRVIGRIEEL